MVLVLIILEASSKLKVIVAHASSLYHPNFDFCFEDNCVGLRNRGCFKSTGIRKRAELIEPCWGFAVKEMTPPKRNYYVQGFAVVDLWVISVVLLSFRPPRI